MTGGENTGSLKAPIAERVREVLRNELLRGRWRGSLPSERHLSNQFQVSRPNIHIALLSLAKDGLLRERRGRAWEIRAVVEQAALAARSRGRRTQVLFLRNKRMLPDLTSLMPLIDSLREKLHRLGYGITMRDPLVRGTRDLDRTLTQFEAEDAPAFYILASLPQMVQQWFDQRRLPALIFGTRAPGIRLPAMDVASEATVRHAVRYLASRGHRRIALLDLPPARSTGAELLHNAFRGACAAWEKGIVVGMIEHAVARQPTFESAVDRLLSRANPPTAFIVTEVELTIGLYSLLARRGLRIPEDVSVLCFYRWPILDALRPLPTCYGYSWESFANRVVRIARNHARVGIWPDTFWNLLPTLREGDSVSHAPARTSGAASRHRELRNR